MSGRHNIMVLRRGDTTSAAPTSTIIRSPVFIALLGVIVCLLLLVLALGLVLRKANTKLETSPTCVTCTSVQCTEVQQIRRPGHTLGYEDRRQASRSDVSVIEAKNLTLHPAGLQVMNRTASTLSEVPLVPSKALRRNDQVWQNRRGWLRLFGQTVISKLYLAFRSPSTSWNSRQLATDLFATAVVSRAPI